MSERLGGSAFRRPVPERAAANPPAPFSEQPQRAAPEPEILQPVILSPSPAVEADAKPPGEDAQTTPKAAYADLGLKGPDTRPVSADERYGFAIR